MTKDQFFAVLDAYTDTWDRRREDIPYAIKSSVITQIVRTRSIDSTRFIRAVDFREDGLDADGYRYLIDSFRDREVTYDGFLEFGTNRLNAYGVLISPRFNYAGGIENAPLEGISDSIANESFAR